MTNYERFLLNLKNKQPELFSKIKIIGQYISSREHILVGTKYGNCLITPNDLLKGHIPTIVTAINKTEYFINELKDKQPKLFNDIEIIGNYKGIKTKILVKTKYGECLVTPGCLLNGSVPSIKTAVNYTDYFKNQLQDKNPKIFNLIEIIGNISSKNRYIVFNTKHGKCKIQASSLFNSKKIDIQSAVNKTEYFIAQAKEVHGDLYDYSLVEYVNSCQKVKIISSEGIFEQTPHSHLQGQGCPKLNILVLKKRYKETLCNLYKDSDYINKGLKSKNFDSFKVYIIKCYNDDELFYKIGKTYLKVKERFSRKKDMPYNYEIIKEIIFEKSETGGKECCEMERSLQTQHKEFKYISKKEFGGMSECFSKIL